MYGLTNLAIGILQFIAGIFLLYVMYRIIRLADILDVIKRKYEADARVTETEARVDLSIAQQIAKTYGVEIAPKEPTRRERLMAKLKAAKEEKKDVKDEKKDEKAGR